jgi:glycosyltransferase involved in cell wall biosynthesis
VPPRFSIITPSYKQLEWLKLCAASISDQRNGEVEHIVQDAGTGVELETWAIQQPGLKLHVEKDAGMYDAINRGLAKARGEICAYLNCDEQYLPEALSHVDAAFKRNPKIDILLAGTLVVDGRGQYICSRPGLTPRLRDLDAGRMYNLSCAMFFRAELFRDRKLFFDPTLRIIGDLDWLRRAMKAGARVETLNFFTSTFSDLGTNLALSASAKSEIAEIPENFFRRLSYLVLIMSHRLRRLVTGHYLLRPFDYSIYTLEGNQERQAFHVAKPTGVWRNRL